MSDRTRQPAGISSGGQFATEPKSETGVALPAVAVPDGLTSWGEAFAWDATTPRATGIGPQWVGPHCLPACHPSNHAEMCEWYRFDETCTDEHCTEKHRSLP